MYDVFVSYARGDVALARFLKEKLDHEHLRAFVDVDSLRAGQEWPRQLGEAVKRSRMVVLCWSAEAAASEWVKAEIRLSLLTGKRVLPWLLDATPLLPELSQTHGVAGTDPDAVATEVSRERRRCNMRRMMQLAPAGVLAALMPWWGWRIYEYRRVPFRGHIFDEGGNPLVGALVEADGVRGRTDENGAFRLVLSGPPGRGLHIVVRKEGFVRREIDTQSDVPDFGVALERER